MWDKGEIDQFLDEIDYAKVKVNELKAACQPEDIHESHGLIINKLRDR